MRRYLLLFVLLIGALGASAQTDGQPTATALFFDLEDGALADSGFRYAEVRYTMPDAGHIVLNDFMRCGRDLSITLGDADAEGYYDHLTFDLDGAHDHYGRHLYLCADYGAMDMGEADRTDSFFADYCWFYEDATRSELCLTYWSEARHKWNVCMVDFNREYVPCWNGEILYPEAQSVDDLLRFRLTFEHAHSVTSGPTDLLAVIFDHTGDPYAIAFCGEGFDFIGAFSAVRDEAVIDFVKFSDLSASMQSSMRIAASRLGTNRETASVVFASCSFVVDDKSVDEMLVHEYEFSGGGLLTDVRHSAADLPAAPRKTYDASGRQVDHYNKHRGHFYIEGGRKEVGR